MAEETQDRASLEKQLKRKRLVEQLSKQRSMKADVAEDLAPSTGEERAGAALSGFGESATFGYLPEIQAAVEPAMQKGYELATGEDLGDSGTYDERLEQKRRTEAATQAQAPGYAMAGNVAGFAAPGAGLAKGLKAGAKFLKGARMAKAAKGVTMADKAANLKAGRSGFKYGAEKLAEGALGKGSIAQKAKGLATLGAVEGAAYNPDYIDSETGEMVDGSRMQGAAFGAGFGGVLPPGLHIAGKSIQSIGKAGAWTGNKFLTTFFGVEEGAIKKYLENPDLINKATDFEQVKNAIDEIVSPIRRELNEADIDFKEAKVRFGEAEKRIYMEFSEKGKEIKKAFAENRELLNREYKTSYDQLNKVKAPLHLQDAVETGMERLKNNVVQGSNEALDLLQYEMKDNPLDINGAATIIDDSLERLAIRGEIPEAGPSREVALEISKLQNDLARFGGEITAYDAKKYIKNLDRYIDWGEREFGRHGRPDVTAAKDVRRYLDGVLKTASPGYMEMMQAVAEDRKSVV